MRINARIGIITVRNPRLPEPKVSYSQGLISVGRDIRARIGIRYVMIVSTKASKLSRIFRLDNNVDHILGRFVNDGQATVCFKEPAARVYIRNADPAQLGQMLNLINRLCKGDVGTIDNGGDEKMNCEASTSTVQLPFARPAKREELASEVHVLYVISEKRLLEASRLKSLRLLSISGIEQLSARRLQNCTKRLPKLETLTVFNCTLVDFDTDRSPWYASHLDLRTCSSLIDVSVTNCMLQHVPLLPPNIRSLDLSYNAIVHIPGIFFLMCVLLERLCLRFNLLSELPPQLLLLNKLGYLSLEGNYLYRPALQRCGLYGLEQCLLPSLECISDGPALPRMPGSRKQTALIESSNDLQCTKGVPSLFSLAARTVQLMALSSRQYVFTETNQLRMCRMPPHVLIDALNDTTWRQCCVCRTLVDRTLCNAGTHKRSKIHFDRSNEMAPPAKWNTDVQMSVLNPFFVKDTLANDESFPNDAYSADVFYPLQHEHSLHRQSYAYFCRKCRVRFAYEK